MREAAFSLRSRASWLSTAGRSRPPPTFAQQPLLPNPGAPRHPKANNRSPKGYSISVVAMGIDVGQKRSITARGARFRVTVCTVCITEHPALRLVGRTDL